MTASAGDSSSVVPLPYRRKRTAALLVSEHAAAANVPYSAMLEIADRCNEACVHCYQIQGQKGELATEHWEKVMRELSELGVMFLTFSGGEPTLRKDFLHLVAYARKLRFAVKIFSNALNITDALAAELGRLAVQEVQISLYSHRAEVHDGVTRVPGAFERVVSAVRALRGAGVKVLLKSPLMSLNAPDYSEYVEFVTRLGADYTLDPKLNPRENGDMAPTALAIDKSTYLALWRDPRFGGKRRPSTARSLDATPCTACSGNVHVEPNGELRPCTQWDIKTGHVSSTSVREAWYENPAAETIRRLSWNDLPGCRVCDLRAYCHRCFAESERYSGDALAPYARACQSARWKYEAERGVEPEIDCDGEQCATVPLGPFRAAGEHRFLVEYAIPEHAVPMQHGVPSAPRPRRSWLSSSAVDPNLPVTAHSTLTGTSPFAGASFPDGVPTSPPIDVRGLVQLRRRAAGPALTIPPVAPSRQGA
jgi:radical SAM protein with 4Fe4S-binding SPASM domain